MFHNKYIQVRNRCCSNADFALKMNAFFKPNTLFMHNFGLMSIDLPGVNLIVQNEIVIIKYHNV